MDAAEELTWTYLQRVPRWWAGKGPAAKPQINRSTPDLSALSDYSRQPSYRVIVSCGCSQKLSRSRARWPHRSRDTP
ncbi:hypothetical protein E1J29_03220 [Xanthomonas hortorum pv. vitians]|nr:hypothetical protein [Xanthomonas hortorum pv. vitians]NMI24776.1 hypothetical protein [Xanthomonas hortorum pv. vitians]NMI30619.1 hypothetical protein [Xanthomonas hortorum pv. vitians]NMI33679.1 hypothetical protein [Xanthomonas hortorum pv. vitians]NMI37650.1 hypothetical protein [Xanthomonas hortorum pv. vitians]